MRANRTSGSMRGYWRLTMVGLVRHRQTKEAGTDRPDLPSDSQALLYPVLRVEEGRPAYRRRRRQQSSAAKARSEPLSLPNIAVAPGDVNHAHSALPG